MKKFLAISFVLLLLVAGAWAEIPDNINVQGILMDNNSNAIVSNKIPTKVKFEIPEINWSEELDVTTDEDGIFNVILGEKNKTLKNSTFNDPYTLKITIDPTGKNIPLNSQAFTAVPYALNSYRLAGVKGETIINDINNLKTKTTGNTTNISNLTNQFNSFVATPGPQGPAGPQGIQGKDGTTWYSGAVTPTNSLGNNGDYYLDTTTGDVYKKDITQVNNWQYQSNIKGAKGDAGVQGTNGSKWFTGTGIPGALSGQAAGDYFLDTTSGDIYKSNNTLTWSKTGSLNSLFSFDDAILTNPISKNRARQERTGYGLNIKNIKDIGLLIDQGSPNNGIEIIQNADGGNALKIIPQNNLNNNAALSIETNNYQVGSLATFVHQQKEQHDSTVKIIKTGIDSSLPQGKNYIAGLDIAVEGILTEGIHLKSFPNRSSHLINIEKSGETENSIRIKHNTYRDPAIYIDSQHTGIEILSNEMGIKSQGKVAGNFQGHIIYSNAKLILFPLNFPYVPPYQINFKEDYKFYLSAIIPYSGGSTDSVIILSAENRDSNIPTPVQAEVYERLNNGFRVKVSWHKNNTNPNLDNIYLNYIILN